MLEWVVLDDIINSTVRESLVPWNVTYSLDLTLDVVTTSDAGQYTCRANVTDLMGETAIVYGNHTIFVTSKSYQCQNCNEWQLTIFVKIILH